MFYYPLPRHPAVLKSLEEIFEQSRGEGNPLLFDLQVFLHSIKAFASLTHKHTSCQHSFQVHFYFPRVFVWNTKEVNVFLFTMENDILPLSSVPVLYYCELEVRCSVTSEAFRS